MGCADRSAYDLSVHSKTTGENLSAKRVLDTPIIEEKLDITRNMSRLGKCFGSDTKLIVQYLDSLKDNTPKNQEKLNDMQKKLESDGYGYLPF